MGSTIRKNSPTIAKMPDGSQTQLITNSSKELIVTVDTTATPLNAKVFQNNNGIPVLAQAVSEGQVISSAPIIVTGAIEEQESPNVVSALRTFQESLQTSIVFDNNSIVVQVEEGISATAKTALSNLIGNLPTAKISIIAFSLNFDVANANWVAVCAFKPF